MISVETATDIAVIYRDIKAAEDLLAQVNQAIDKMNQVDIRDAFGRRQYALQLGVPSGDNGHRILHVPYQLAIPVIEATIASHHAKLKVLNEKAKIEVADDQVSKLCSHEHLTVDEITGAASCRNCGAAVARAAAHV